MGSWSGSAVGFSEPGGVSEGVSAAQVPPEVWQRLLWAYQGWLRRHEGLARVLLRLTRVCQRITFVLMVAALAVVTAQVLALVMGMVKDKVMAMETAMVTTMAQ